jgi:hypothetical protein
MLVNILNFCFEMIVESEEVAKVVERDVFLPSFF